MHLAKSDGFNSVRAAHYFSLLLTSYAELDEHIYIYIPVEKEAESQIAMYRSEFLCCAPINIRSWDGERRETRN